MRKAIFLGISLILVSSIIYVYWYYYSVYGDGYREGELQVISRKGNLFKTYEGEMVLLGFGPRNGALKANYFHFSVTDEKVASRLEKSMGKIVKVHYVQYRRSLPWRGQNYKGDNSENGQYIVDRIDEVREQTGTQQQTPINPGLQQ